MQMRTLFSVRISVMSLFILLATCYTLVIAHAEEMSPLDTPVPVVGDWINDWAIGGGFLYWIPYTCGIEGTVDLEVYRKPVAGGTERMVTATQNTPICVYYGNLLSSNDGLYYFNGEEGRIERISLGEPYSIVAIKSLRRSESPILQRTLVETSRHLYWLTASGILRTQKDGNGAVETFAITNGSPTDLQLTRKSVVWLDNSGLHKQSITCSPLPCGNSTPIVPFDANTKGEWLAYQPLESGTGPIIEDNYRIYWAQRNISTTPTYTIRYCEFTGIFDCREDVISPGDVNTAAISVDSPVTFYTATRNWRIGKPLFAQGNLYWTEADSASNFKGDVKRRASNATSPVTQADTIATNQLELDVQLYVANELLYFGTNSGIYSLPLNASAIVRELVASALEVTQGIQNLANGVPLVADKITYVRAYAMQTRGPNTPNVETQLVGTRNGQPLPGSPLRPINPVLALITNEEFDRGNPDSSWYFLLPSSWKEVGTITLKLQVDPRQIHRDPNRANNEKSAIVTFQSQPPVCVMTVPVSTHTPLPSVDDPNFWSMIDQFTRRWPTPDTWIFVDDDPIEELEICWSWFYGPHPCWEPLELSQGIELTNPIPDKNWVIMTLFKRATTTFNPDVCDDIDAPVHFMGLVHPDADTGTVRGYASLISTESWVKLPPHSPVSVSWKSGLEGSVMAQELAHNYGRNHVGCGSNDIDAAYPYERCAFGDPRADQHFGFDVASRAPIRATSTGDFMSYRQPGWVSDYTWKALIGKFSQVQSSTYAENSAAGGDSLLIVGAVDDVTKQGFLSYAYSIPSATLPQNAPSSNVQSAHVHLGETPHVSYTLRLLGVNDSLLSQHTPIVGYVDAHDPSSAPGYFAEKIPDPAAQVLKIELLADTTVIAILQPGAGKPTLAIQQPTAASVIDDDLFIQWSASDQDANDRLLYLVQYSYNNGAHWQTLVSDYPGSDVPTTTLLVEDVMGLHASAGQSGLIRVLASDGINTTIATSQPFTLKNRKPIPFITVPVTGQSFPASQPIVLSGGANDTEDGGLTENSLQWLVDGVPVGVGSNLLLAGIAPGLHTATLRATDSLSSTVAVQVQFQISPLSIPQLTTPAMDGFCNDSAYLTATNVHLAPYPDGSQATVRLLRTTNDLWVCFSGMITGTNLPGALAGLHIDVNLSRSDLAQPDDLAFFAGEDGDVFIAAGNGVNGFTGAGVDGLTAQVSAEGSTWNAELRIAGSKIGGLDHQIGLKLGHHSVTAQGDDYHWPYQATPNSPKTWATATLGSQPLITVLEPFTATIGSTPFTITVEGEGFVKGSQVEWNGVPLSTTFVTANQLIGNVGVAQLANANDVSIVVRNPAPGNAQSNQVAFEVVALPPSINSLSPNAVLAGSSSILLTINGANFTDNAQVLWNGELLTATLVNSGQLTVQIDSEKLAVGQNVGVVVQNQTPDVRISNMQEFLISPVALTQQQKVYLPLVAR